MGAFDMIARGIANESNEEYSVYLKGDLCQMDAQHKFLTRWGISVKFNNVYPCVRECDKEKTFKLLWEKRCDGWWHYDAQYVALGICTPDEFSAALTRQCERDRL